MGDAEFYFELLLVSFPTDFNCMSRRHRRVMGPSDDRDQGLAEKSESIFICRDGSGASSVTLNFPIYTRIKGPNCTLGQELNIFV